MLRRLLSAFGFAFAFTFTILVVACGGAESATNANSGAGAGGGAGGGGEAEPPPDVNGCCAPDRTQSGCMNLGGYVEGGNCFRTCDFWCSTNWRVEKDEHGCDAWHYDLRAPKEGEDATCTARPKPVDAGAD